MMNSPTQNPCANDELSKPMTPNNDPKVGDRVSKYFKNDGWFSGHISEVWKDENNDTFYHIIYEDDDEEDLILSEVIHGKRKYMQHNKLLTATLLKNKQLSVSPQNQESSQETQI